MKKKCFAFISVFTLMISMSFTACGSKKNTVTEQQEDADGKNASDFDEESTSGSAKENGKDSDGDGIGDSDEKKKYKTNPYCIASDADMLSDGEEILEYKTNPLEADTDGDGAGDEWETCNGFDANTKDDLFYIEETVSGDGTSLDIELSLKGKYVESYHFWVHENDNLFINSLISGYLGSGYDLLLDGECDNMMVTYHFDESFLKEENFNPVIYHYNEEEQELVPIETQWDGKSSFVTAEITEFSTYLLLDKTKHDEAWEYEIMPPS